MLNKTRQRKKETMDPITYEVVKHKIWQNLWEGRATMELVSGSVVVTEAKEVLYGLYDRDGNIVASSAGLLVHITGGEEMIKNIISWYSEEPGIYDGDVFFFNDPYVGGVHVPDAACIAPFFYDGELAAWLIALFHTPEMGAIEPSSMMPNATEIFHEGIRCPGIKLMEKGRERRENYKLLQRMVRDPGGITLDCRARVAGLNVGNVRLKELYDKYGRETMEEVFDRMVLETEKIARAKLAKLPDGTWREVVYLDYDGQKYNLYKICLTMTKAEDRLTLDFTGTSPQLPGPTNMSLQGLIGSVFTTLCTRLFYEEQWNRGILNVIEINAPEGTILNCKWPAALNISVFLSVVVMSLLHSCISKMLCCSEEYYGDQNAAWMGNFTCLFWGGMNQYGLTMGSVLFDCLASGQGAGSYFDGTDTGCFPMTPEVIAGDVEMYESIMPFLYITKRQAPDSGGPGKYRGGAGLEIIYKLHKTPGVKIMPLGIGKKTSMGPGLWGGNHPGTIKWVVAKDTNAEEIFRRGEGPYTLEDIYKLEGDVKDYPPMPPPMFGKSGDIIYAFGDGGGGYGDPIDRDPRLVLKDVINELVSAESAKDIYGVIIEPRISGVVTDHRLKKKLTVDWETTREKREAIRTAREERARRFAAEAGHSFKS